MKIICLFVLSLSVAIIYAKSNSCDLLKKASWQGNVMVEFTSALCNCTWPATALSDIYNNTYLSLNITTTHGRCGGFGSCPARPFKWTTFGECTPKAFEIHDDFLKLKGRINSSEIYLHGMTAVQSYTSIVLKKT